MGTRATISGIQALSLAMLATSLAAIAPGAVASPDGRITIGVPAPQAQAPDPAGPSLSEPIRQGLAQHLGGASLVVVPLQAASPAEIDAEGRQQHCDYILYSTIEQKHGGSIGGFLHKLSPIASALPMLGGLGRGGGGGSVLGAVMQTVGQSAAQASAAATQQQVMQQLTGAQASSLKAGDTVTFEYRLAAVATASVVKADKIVVKARSDGEDLLSPVIQQVANEVVTATGRAPTGGAPTPAAPTSDARANFGGQQPPGAQGPDCDHLPASAGSVISADACRKMMGAQSAYTAAAADPRGLRPGDESMSCAQITAELKQQSYTTPDKAKVADAQAAAATEQKTLVRQEAEVTKTVAVETVAMEGAMAADTATAVATGGVVRGRQAQTLQKTFDAQNKIMGERMAEERRPTETKLFNSTADFASDAGQQLTANPRLARLMQLANAKRCKGG